MEVACKFPNILDNATNTGGRHRNFWNYMQELLRLILEPIAEILFLFIGYPIGWILVTLGTLGTIEPGPLERVQDYSFYRSKGMKWWHVTCFDDGRRYLPAESVAGVAWISLIGIGILIGMLIYYGG